MSIARVNKCLPFFDLLLVPSQCVQPSMVDVPSKMENTALQGLRRNKCLGKWMVFAVLGHFYSQIFETTCNRADKKN